MYIFDFGNLDFWTVDIIFILLFMDIYFVIKYYRHQIFSMGFIIVFDTISLVISSFLPYTNHEDIEDKKRRAEEMRQSFTENYKDLNIGLSMSFGISQKLIRSSRDIEDFIDECDRLMYIAKERHHTS